MEGQLQSIISMLSNARPELGMMANMGNGTRVLNPGMSVGGYMPNKPNNSANISEMFSILKSHTNTPPTNSIPNQSETDPLQTLGMRDHNTNSWFANMLKSLRGAGGMS